MPGLAVDVRLTNGQIYPNAKILAQDSKYVQVQLGNQRLSIPIQVVESIDGVPIRTVATPNVTPSHAASPAPAPTSGPSPLPPAALDPFPAAPAAPTPEAIPVATAPPPVSPTEGGNPQWPAYKHRWNMELLLAIFAALSALWLASVARVQRDLFQRRLDPRFWSNLAIVLPGLGATLYSVVQRMSDIAENAAADRACV